MWFFRLFITIIKNIILFPVKIILSKSLNKENFVFYHIPRSGGRSLIKFLQFYFYNKVNTVNDYRIYKKNNFKFSAVVRQFHKKEIKKQIFL